MNPESLLSQLKDIHGPEAIGWWPPAPGWWILAILIVGAIILGIRTGIKRHKATAWRRQALKELHTLKSQYLAEPSTQTLTHIISLLKRCAASAAHDRSLLALNSEDWKTKLNTSPAIFNASDLDTLCEGHYQPTPQTLDVEAFVRIENWINRLPQ